MSREALRPSQSMRLLAALAYPIWVIALLILLTNLKTDPFMRRHAWLGLYWALVWWVIIPAGIFVIALFPFLHWVYLFFPLVWPAFLLLSIYYGVQAYTEKEFSIPVVSEWAQKHVS